MPKSARLAAAAATFVFLIVVFLGGALIAPFLFWGVQGLADHFTFLQEISKSPFHRYVNRSLILVALVGFWPYLRRLGLHKKEQLGFRGEHPFRMAGVGFLLAVGTVALLAAAAFWGHARIWSPGVLRWEKFIPNTLLASMAVAVLEEVLFRGGLYSSLRLKSAFWPSALLSSSIYAIVHFFAKPFNPELVQWHSGFSILKQMCAGFAEWQLLIPGFLNLVLIGVILCNALDKSGGIYLPIGLHAGFIFGAKAFDFLTEPAPLGRPWIWGTDKLVDGWAAPPLLLLLWFYLRKRGAGRE